VTPPQSPHAGVAQPARKTHQLVGFRIGWWVLGSIVHSRLGSVAYARLNAPVFVAVSLAEIMTMRLFYRPIVLSHIVSV
jgi:hypothetical protein